MSKRKQVTIEDMEKVMAIELLPLKELKKRAEIPVDFSALIKKAVEFDVKQRKKKKGKK